MSIAITHVGGRFGTLPLVGNLRLFHSSFDVALFDMDADASMPGFFNFKTFKTYNIAISEKVGVGSAFLVFDRCASSLKSFDEATDDYCCFEYKRGSPFFLRGVYRLKDVNVCDREVPLSTTRLDVLIKEKKLTCPDILCIDAEGSDHEVLTSMGGYLDELSAVCIEGSLTPYHKGEINLLETWQYLLSKGFALIDLGHHGRYNYFPHEDFQFSSKGVISFFSDVLFLRIPNSGMSVDALTRLCLIAMTQGATSTAYKCLDLLDERGSSNFTDLAKKYAMGALYQFACEIVHCRKVFGNYKVPSVLDLWDVDGYNLMSSNSRTKQSVDRVLVELRNNVGKADLVRRWKSYKELKKENQTLDSIYEKYGLKEIAVMFRNERERKEEFLQQLLALLD